MTVKPLLAYAVTEPDEGTGGIYFARSDIEARKAFASENGDEIRGLSCRRAPWADRLAPGPVPLRELLGNGWWLFCFGCGAKVDQDNEDLDPVFESDRVWCKPGCREADERRRIAMLQRRAEAIEAAVAFFGPSVTRARSHTGEQVRFAFPGGLGEATWNVGAEMVTIEKRDLDAWNRWRESERASNGESASRTNDGTLGSGSRLVV